MAPAEILHFSTTGGLRQQSQDASTDFSLSFRKVESRSDLKECAWLVAERYSSNKRMSFKNTPAERKEILEGYISKHKTVFAAVCRGKIVSTVSVCADKALPMGSIFPEITFYQERGLVKEYGDFATDPDCGYQGAEIMEFITEPMMSVAQTYVIDTGTKYSCAMVHPLHGRLYTSWYAFGYLTHQRDIRPCEKVKAPAVGLVQDVEKVRRQEDSRYAAAYFRIRQHLPLGVAV